MSADYWAVCPRCLKRAHAKYQEGIDAVAALLAKLTEQERKIVHPTVKEADPEDYRTFREDYEFYVNPATARVEVSFSGHCTECGFGIDFSDEREIPGMDE